MILVELMTFKPPWDCAPVACDSLVLEGQRPKMPEAREPPAFLGSSSSNRFWPWGRTIALIRSGCELGLLFCFVLFFKTPIYLTFKGSKQSGWASYDDTVRAHTI